MGIRYILYDPNADSGNCKNEAQKLQDRYGDAVMINIDRINSYEVFFRGLEPDADVIVCGEDCTLNHFVNHTRELEIKNKLYYVPAGGASDFLRTLDPQKGAQRDLEINAYIQELPVVTADGKKALFLGKAGCGADGDVRITGGMARFFQIHSRNASVAVDGKSYIYKKVWSAFVVNGSCGQDHMLSLVLLHGMGKIRAIRMISSALRGKYPKYKKQVSILEGKEMKVEFDRPAAFQIDGEPIRNVISYEAKAAACK